MPFSRSRTLLPPDRSGDFHHAQKPASVVGGSVISDQDLRPIAAAHPRTEPVLLTADLSLSTQQDRTASRHAARPVDRSSHAIQCDRFTPLNTAGSLDAGGPESP